MGAGLAWDSKSTTEQIRQGPVVVALGGLHYEYQ